LAPAASASYFADIVCLIRLCRESLRGWLITIRFVILPTEHGMVPKVFWEQVLLKGRMPRDYIA